MKYLAKIGIGNKVIDYCQIDPEDQMTNDQAVRHMRDTTNNDNWIVASENVNGWSFNPDTGEFTPPAAFEYEA